MIPLESCQKQRKSSGGSVEDWNDDPAKLHALECQVFGNLEQCDVIRHYDLPSTTIVSKIARFCRQVPQDRQEDLRLRLTRVMDSLQREFGSCLPINWTKEQLQLERNFSRKHTDRKEKPLFPGRTSCKRTCTVFSENAAEDTLKGV